MHVARVNKFRGFGTVQQLYENKQDKILDVAVIHPLKQPTGLPAIFWSSLWMDKNERLLVAVLDSLCFMMDSFPKMRSRNALLFVTDWRLLTAVCVQFLACVTANIGLEKFDQSVWFVVWCVLQLQAWNWKRKGNVLRDLIAAQHVLLQACFLLRKMCTFFLAARVGRPYGFVYVVFVVIILERLPPNPNWEFLQTTTLVCCVGVPIQHRISSNRYTSVLYLGANSTQNFFKPLHQCAGVGCQISKNSLETIRLVCHAGNQFSGDSLQTKTPVCFVEGANSACYLSNHCTSVPCTVPIQCRFSSNHYTSVMVAIQLRFSLNQDTSAGVPLQQRFSSDHHTSVVPRGRYVLFRPSGLREWGLRPHVRSDALDRRAGRRAQVHVRHWVQAEHRSQILHPWVDTNAEDSLWWEVTSRYLKPEQQKRKLISETYFLCWMSVCANFLAWLPISVNN